MSPTERTLIAAAALFTGAAFANPIPVPVPASMPLEEMTVTIDRDGHVRFSGDFTFNFIPDGDCGTWPPCLAVTKMLFPLPPVNAAKVAVLQDGRPLTWSMSTDSYPTVLPEYPALAMFEWSGPFPVDGAVFTIDYEHDVFTRGDDWVFFYSLGTGKYFPTYDKITTALLDIRLPGPPLSLEVLLDDMTVDPDLYVLNGSRLRLTLESEYGPFVKDLTVSFQVPAPGPLWLILLGLPAMVGLRRIRPATSTSRILKRARSPFDTRYSGRTATN